LCLITAANKDDSLIVLQELLNSGYTEVTWVYDGFKCPKCRSLDGKKWKLADFIKNLQYEAPIFEKSHVNCGCKLIVKKVNGETAVVDWTGIKQIQKKSEPVKKQKEKPIEKKNWFQKLLHI